MEEEVKVISRDGKYRRDEKKEKRSVDRDSQRDPNIRRIIISSNIDPVLRHSRYKSRVTSMRTGRVDEGGRGKGKERKKESKKGRISGVVKSRDAEKVFATS